MGSPKRRKCLILFGLRHICMFTLWRANPRPARHLPSPSTACGRCLHEPAKTLHVVHSVERRLSRIVEQGPELDLHRRREGLERLVELLEARRGSASRVRDRSRAPPGPSRAARAAGRSLVQRSSDFLSLSISFSMSFCALSSPGVGERRAWRAASRTACADARQRRSGPRRWSPCSPGPASDVVCASAPSRRERPAGRGHGVAQRSRRRPCLQLHGIELLGLVDLGQRPPACGLAARARLRLQGVGGPDSMPSKPAVINARVMIRVRLR